MNLKQKISIVSILLLLAAMPGFSVLATVNSEVVGPVAEITYIAEFKDGAVSSIKNDSNITNIEPVFVGAKLAKFQNTFRFKTKYSREDVLSRYGRNIVYIEHEKVVKVGAVTVNDPGFSSDPNNTDRQWALYKADFVSAWEKTQGSSSVIVAVIDTGIDATHEDLSAGQVVPGFDFLTKSAIPFAVDSDDNGHGTLVSGIIGATSNNFRGITGASWNSLLMPLKALDSKGQGNSGDVAAAIVYAADHGANVVNMSLGGIGFANDTTLSGAVSYAYGKDVVLVSAAGNDVATTGGNLDDNPVFPICDDNGENMVIGVAATDINDQKASFSNYGKVCVDVSAPGKRIISTINHDPVTKVVSHNAYAYGSGTSLATPFVSAEAALVKAMYPSATNRQIRDRIIKSADPIDALNPTQCNGMSCTRMIGSGRINAYKALDASLAVASVQDGDLVRELGTGNIYYITGGQKQPVSSFVLSQRFANKLITDVYASDLQKLPVGPYALPVEGTVVKSPSNPTVYMVIDGVKRPITYQVFVQRNITQIATVTELELATWVTGKFLAPVEGTLVKTPKNPTVYWVVEAQLHPINYAFWMDRGLNIFPIMIISDNDLKSYPIGNAYVR